MWPLAVLLWVLGAAVAATAAGCEPFIQQLSGINGGGRTLLLGARPSPPSCHCPRLGIQHWPCPRRDACDCWKVPGLPDTEPTADGPRAQVTVHIAGWYAARCCKTKKIDPCYARPEAEPIWVDGLNYDTWNVTISPKQREDNSLDVEITRQMDPSTSLSFYLPELLVFLRNSSTDKKIESGVIDYRIENRERNSYVFGRNKSLVPGLYKIEVTPRWLHCGGSCKARYLLHEVTAPEQGPNVGQVTVDTTASRTLYLALGVPAGLALVVLVVFVSYRLLRGQRGGRWLDNIHGASHKPPLPDSLAAAGPVSVLLLHRGGGGDGLDQLRAALRAAGIVLLDARERSVLNLMQTYSSPADLLALEAFRDARLLFVADGAGPNGSVPDQLYGNMLRFVRNGRLSLDYGRVFSATLGDAAGDELAGLVEGRLFRVPDDAPLLIEHLLCARRSPVARLCSTESRSGLLPAMVPSPDSMDPGLQPSPV